jgi:hypothetical protein
MDPAQIIGYIATVICIISFQAKTQRGIVIMQTFSALLFSIHFFMLEAYSGALLNGICTIRAIIFTFRHKKWAGSVIWVYVFSFLSFICYLITIFVLTPEPTIKTYFVEFLPVLGNVATTIATRLDNAKLVRRYAFIASPLWLAYNAVMGSIGGIITETFNIISIITAMIRLDFKKK